MKSEQNKYTILVVDDSDLIRKMLKDFFKDYNVEVLTCDDGLEGIKLATDLKPDLIFLDLLMPNLDGLKTIQVIKMIDSLRHIPIIVISGNASRANVMAAHEAGAERVVSKPLNKEVILKHVKELFGDLSYSPGKSVSNIIDEKEIIELRKLFLSSFLLKKTSIKESLRDKNSKLLKSLVHDLRGVGSTIGYPQLTSLSGEIENKLESLNVEWSYIRIKIEQLFSIINEMENSIQTVER